MWINECVIVGRGRDCDQRQEVGEKCGNIHEVCEIWAVQFTSVRFVK